MILKLKVRRLKIDMFIGVAERNTPSWGKVDERCEPPLDIATHSPAGSRL